MVSPELDSAWGVLLLVLAPQIWIARCYSRLPIGQDEGLWLLWGLTGASPYRDHVDCKPPGVHLWGWALSRLGGRDVARVKLLHHTAVAALSAAVALSFESVWSGVAFGALAHSVRLYGNHAWVEQISAGALALGLASGGWVSVHLLAASILFNLKLAPAVLVLLLGRGQGTEAASLGLAAIVVFVAARIGGWEILSDMDYGCWVVARRMVAWRKDLGLGLLPGPGPLMGGALLLAVPSASLSFAADPDPALWLSAAAYLLTNAAGRTWRPYHLIPLAAYVAPAAPPALCVLALADWCAAGMYVGDVISRLRPLVGRRMREARVVGEYLRDRVGTLWVTDEFTQIYVYARKPPFHPCVEQVEIRHVAWERLAVKRPGKPTLVVLGPGTRDPLPSDYRTLFVHGSFTVIEPA